MKVSEKEAISSRQKKKERGDLVDAHELPQVREDLGGVQDITELQQTTLDGGALAGQKVAQHGDLGTRKGHLARAQQVGVHVKGVQRGVPIWWRAHGQQRP